MARLLHLKPPAPPEIPLDAAALDTLEALFPLAEEVAAADRRIKEAVLEAARRGDCGRVAELVERWLEEPAVEVAAGICPEGD